MTRIVLQLDSKSLFVPLGSCKCAVAHFLGLATAFPLRTQLQACPHLFSVHFMILVRQVFFTILRTSIIRPLIVLVMNSRLTTVCFNHGPWFSFETIKSIDVFASSVVSPFKLIQHFLCSAIIETCDLSGWSTNFFPTRSQKRRSGEYARVQSLSSAGCTAHCTSPAHLHCFHFVLHNRQFVINFIFLLSFSSFWNPCIIFDPRASTSFFPLEPFFVKNIVHVGLQVLDVTSHLTSQALHGPLSFVHGPLHVLH